MIASLRNTLTALVFGAFVGSVWAAGEAPSLKADHPSRYIVQKGDTLWDISGRFLREPWRWPDVWRANPQVKNPDLIYPGDELRLSYQDGRPIITVRRRARRGVTQLSPKVRAQSLADESISTIPFDAIQQFLEQPRVVDDVEFDASPYILSVGREALSAHPGSKVYVRGLGDSGATRYSVYRKGNPYLDPSNDNELLGFEALHVADAVLHAAGDPATLIITNTYREVLVGDRLVAIDRDESQHKYQPRPVADGIDGQIISVVDGVSQIGQFSTVVLNRGARDGLEVGHVFAVYQRGEVVEDPLARDPEQVVYEEREKQRDAEMDKVRGTGDAFLHGVGHAVESVTDLIGRESRRVQNAVTGEKPWAEVTLPDERAGTVMVYRSFGRVSYALVMHAERPMHVLDSVKKP